MFRASILEQLQSGRESGTRETAHHSTALDQSVQQPVTSLKDGDSLTKRLERPVAISKVRSGGYY